jgi:hypothetical protein
MDLWFLVLGLAVGGFVGLCAALYDHWRKKWCVLPTNVDIPVQFNSQAKCPNVNKQPWQGGYNLAFALYVNAPNPNRRNPSMYQIRSINQKETQAILYQSPNFPRTLHRFNKMPARQTVDLVLWDTQNNEELARKPALYIWHILYIHCTYVEFLFFIK